MVIKGYPSSTTTSNLIAFLLQLGKLEISCHRLHTKPEQKSIVPQRLLQLRGGGNRKTFDKLGLVFQFFTFRNTLASDRIWIEACLSFATRMRIRRSVIQRFNGCIKLIQIYIHCTKGGPAHGSRARPRSTIATTTTTTVCLGLHRVGVDLSFEERERERDVETTIRIVFSREGGARKRHSWTRLTFLHYARPDFRPIPRRVDGKGFAAASVRFAAIVGKIGGARSKANGTTPTSFQSVKFDPLDSPRTKMQSTKLSFDRLAIRIFLVHPELRKNGRREMLSLVAQILRIGFFLPLFRRWKSVGRKEGQWYHLG